MSNRQERRSLKFDGLHDTVAEIRDLHESGYAKAGNWNLSQACQHLTKTLRMSVEGAPFSLPFFLKPVARWMLFRTVMEGKPTRLPLKTVPQFLPDDSNDNEQDIGEYEQMVNHIMADDASFIPDHPVFGKVSAEQWRKFHVWHAAHHLSFLLPSKNSA